MNDKLSSNCSGTERQEGGGVEGGRGKGGKTRRGGGVCRKGGGFGL